jgi:transcriptional regulator with XRE-family HTH domain
VRQAANDEEQHSMGVTVYSRLGDLLRARNLTVADLQDRIAARFGLAVDARTLDRLARSERVRRPDLEVAAAVASVLDIGLDDLFAVDAVPLGAEDTTDSYDPAEGDDILAPEQSRRLSELFDLRDRRSLTEEEQVELNALVAAWGRAVNERGIHELAARRGVPVEQMRAEVLADVERALAWWREAQANQA